MVQKKDNLQVIKKGFNPCSFSILLHWLPVVFIAMMLTGSCRTNPATGEAQLILLSEEQEIELGRQTDADLVQSIGIYQAPELAAYVEEIGLLLARMTERPQLPWTFRILDDPAVNAFALPGGFIYVTRGILSYMNNEAELAGVLSHEIAHVTALHAAERISTQQLILLGWGLGTAIEPALRDFEPLVGLSVGLLFLRFSREDELQSDELAIRYMLQADYAPRQLINVMEMLEAVSGATPGGMLPEWLSTHPTPANRIENIAEELEEREPDLSTLKVRRDIYLNQLDGMVFGANPREGFFEDSIFYHPALEFRYEFPENWQTSNMKQAVTGVSPEQNAIIQVSLTGQETLSGAMEEFFTREGIRKTGVTRSVAVNGLPSLWSEFSANVEETNLRGRIAFVSYQGKIFRLLGYSTQASWNRYQATITASFRTFNRVTDPDILTVEPMRIRIVTLNAGMSVAEFYRRYPSAVPLEIIVLINRLEPDATLIAGQKLKQVVQ